MKMFLLAASALALTAAAPAFPDRNGKAVVDAANVLPDDQELVLNNKIVAWNKATQHQLVVATIPSLQGRDIKDYGYQLFRSYALGRKGVDDGVMLILAPSERKVRIEVGGGLEESLTDGLTSEIIKTSIVPQLKAGDIPAALRDGANEIMANAAIDEARAVTIVDNQKKGSGDTVLWLLGLIGFGGVATWWGIARSRRKDREALEKAKRDAEHARRYAAKRTEDLKPGEATIFVTPPRPRCDSEGFTRPTRPARPRTQTFERPSPRVEPIERVTPVFVPTPSYSPPPPPPPSPSYSSDWGSSSSSDSSSSFDSGGGSGSGGGSDSSY